MTDFKDEVRQLVQDKHNLQMEIDQAKMVAIAHILRVQGLKTKHTDVGTATAG